MEGQTLRYRSLVSLTLAVVLITPAVAQEPTKTDQTLEEIGEWLTSKLPDYGGFRITAIYPEAEFRLEITDVSFTGCELRYTQQTREGMMGMPSIAKVVLPLRSVDIASIITEPLDLGRNVRLEGHAGQVYLVVRPDAPSLIFEIDRQEVHERALYIPLDSSRHSRELVEKLQVAAGLCSGG
jgi:hypothetical protein